MRSDMQKGMTFTSALIGAFIVGFFLTIIFKLAPHYMDNRIIQGAMDQVCQSGIENKTDSEIRRKLADFFVINNIHDVDLSKIEINRDKAAIHLELNYEKRFAMFGNVDVVLKFSNQFDGQRQTY